MIRMLQRLRSGALIALLGLVLIFAGCSASSNDGGPTSRASATTAFPAADYELDNYQRYDPDRETIGAYKDGQWQRYLSEPVVVARYERGGTVWEVFRRVLPAYVGAPFRTYTQMHQYNKGSGRYPVALYGLRRQGGATVLDAAYQSYWFHDDVGGLVMRTVPRTWPGGEEPAYRVFDLERGAWRTGGRPVLKVRQLKKKGRTLVVLGGDERTMVFYGPEGEEYHRRDGVKESGGYMGYLEKLGGAYGLHFEDGGQSALAIYDVDFQPMDVPIVHGVRRLALGGRVKQADGEMKTEWEGYNLCPSQIDPKLYYIMEEHFLFAPPPGSVGVKPLPVQNARFWDGPYAGSDMATNQSTYGGVLVAYETPEGRHWGHMNFDFSESTGPVWQAVELRSGEQLKRRFDMRQVDREPQYLFVQELDDSWTAYDVVLGLVMIGDGFDNIEKAYGAAEQFSRAIADEEKQFRDARKRAIALRKKHRRELREKQLRRRAEVERRRAEAEAAQRKSAGTANDRGWSRSTHPNFDRNSTYTSPMPSFYYDTANAIANDTGYQKMLERSRDSYRKSLNDYVNGRSRYAPRGLP